MFNNPKTNEDDGVTYIAGLGFAPNDNRQNFLRALRININVVSLFLILGIACSYWLVKPFLYLTNFIGLKTHINFSTGLIIASDYSSLVAQMLAKLTGIAIPLILIFLFFRKKIREAQNSSVSKPSLGYYIPMSCAVAILGVTAVLFFNFASYSLFGIKFDASLNIIKSFNAESFTLIGFLFAFSVFEEILFRGFILSLLKRFGAGFAIIMSSVMSALFYCNLSDFIFMFLLGIALSYFVVHSNSVLTAVISRVCITAIIISSQLIYSLVETTLALVIISVSCIFIILVAGIAFMRFIQLDNKAFTFQNEDEVMPTGNKLSIALSSFMFMTLLFLSVMIIVFNIQIIGR